MDTAVCSTSYLVPGTSVVPGIVYIPGIYACMCSTVCGEILVLRRTESTRFVATTGRTDLLHSS